MVQICSKYSTFTTYIENLYVLKGTSLLADITQNQIYSHEVSR